jgi:signal transduction histidine kinase
MRLRTKLVLTATGLTFAIAFVLSMLFLGSLMHQRIEQTSTSNEVLAHEVLLVTRQAVVSGLRAHPPLADLPRDNAGPILDYDPEAALHAAVLDALRSSDALSEVMNAIVRYSPTVQDVSVTDAHGFTMVSTDPDALNQPASFRTSFASVRDGSLLYQMRQVYGKPRVLDISEPLDRNGLPFLVVHLGVHSTLLRSVYEPWLHNALWIALLAAFASMAASALLSIVALRPLQAIGEQLERLTLTRGDALFEHPAHLLEASSGSELMADPVGRVNRTIDRLGRQMRSTEEGYTALQTNMNQMLDTLRDGVLLFTADRRAVMVSDAVAHFVGRAEATPDFNAGAQYVPHVDAMVGMQLEQIFAPETALGAAVLAAFESGRHISAETVQLEDGRQVQISLDRIDDAGGAYGDGAEVHKMGTLLTLRDTASALELEQELEVSRRLAAIGRLTANVGHEVKNPINAMVVHLELLRAKLAAGAVEREGAQRHVEILADEMHRLDRVVQTLADFSRPMDLDLREHDLRRVVEQVIDLAGAELKEQGVLIQSDSPAQPILARVDGELMRQALLNLALNAMQAMPGGGTLRVSIRREQRLAVIEIADNGTGIPAAVLPRIFDLYFTTKSTGSGIGLAMTYRILQLHGGAMDVRSNTDPDSPDRGTTFTLRIPVSVAPASEGRKPPSRLASGPKPATPAFAEPIATTIETNTETKEIV